jgi:hypothetical protein
VDLAGRRPRGCESGEKAKDAHDDDAPETPQHVVARFDSDSQELLMASTASILWPVCDARHRRHCGLLFDHVTEETIREFAGHNCPGDLTEEQADECLGEFRIDFTDKVRKRYPLADEHAVQRVCLATPDRHSLREAPRRDERAMHGGGESIRHADKPNVPPRWRTT